MKQVIVVVESLDLPRGKLAAQVAHAAVDGFLAASTESRRRWLEAGMPKVVLRGGSAGALVDLAERARAAGLPVALIRDAGRTVLAAGTLTCLGLGPASEDDIDRFTGSLPLL